MFYFELLAIAMMAALTGLGGARIQASRVVTSVWQRPSRMYTSCRYARPTWRLQSSAEDTSPDLSSSLQVLQTFNDKFNQRVKNGRSAGKTAKLVEFERAQQLKGEGIRAERELLAASTATVCASASCVVLGILADSGQQGASALAAWVGALGLRRGVLRAYDEAGEIAPALLDSAPVYIKYNSTTGDAYAKANPGGFVGVIFQPTVSEDAFVQYGNLPLLLFK
ncbi:hypothetical protein B484DRAFT_454947 [Ochromonadaceae sp. CCMP2298]|nr:hypothetical protein B484DRAFT_454947 [Ochromonadaceae sp. CCMP2298]|mmetsp:Transcript_9719/g.21599  ORF Transcript_9719/g.21599 Transcript_9719/m.21599 type:complete len:224 (+) Transcript_9719:79-750(+)